jgi:phenylalanyl-tRNA synthetase beta chain
LAADPTRPESEPLQVSLVSEQSFAEMKGIVESLAMLLNRSAEVTVKPSELEQFQPGRGSEVWLNGERWGWLGEISTEVRDKLGLRDAVTVAELNLANLEKLIDLAPQYVPVAQFPASERDLNFVLDDAISWEELSEVVREAAGPLLETLSFAGQYRGPQIPANKKSYVLALHYRSPERTLTTQEIDAAQQAVIRACEAKLGATLR